MKLSLIAFAIALLIVGTTAVVLPQRRGPDSFATGSPPPTSKPATTRAVPPPTLQDLVTGRFRIEDIPSPPLNQLLIDTTKRHQAEPNSPERAARVTWIGTMTMELVKRGYKVNQDGTLQPPAATTPATRPTSPPSLAPIGTPPRGRTP